MRSSGKGREMHGSKVMKNELYENEEDNRKQEKEGLRRGG
jgi:hypothetical protein